MQLILLSGGSGKRLWPLSNDARSKQFLPLLEREDGTMETMVQRVVRQLREAKLTENITVVTNNSQVDNITNQLGDTVSVVTEPEHRGTFPAIALASYYLLTEGGCNEDEVAIVMPCDPFVDSNYYDAIRCMPLSVMANITDLMFLGISPAYPSDNYGYLMPVKGQSPLAIHYDVDRFVEKPTAEVAEKLIQEGGYWNGGVFAFKLGYMLDIIEKYVPVKDISTSWPLAYECFLLNFANLPETSFDVEVAEKATSAAFVPFRGQWQDLGSWNILTSHLSQPVMGNAVMGPHCENTHVINELQQPIYVDGLKDVVVAACPDGILVCSKEHSEDIKHAVTGLASRPMYEERRWGTYRVLDDSYYADGRHALTKSITLRPGKNISYQIHHHRSETWTFVQGEGIFVLDGQEQLVKAGDTVIIPVEHWHAIKALTELTFIEVQSGNPLIEEDIERTEWNWSE